MGPMDLKRNRYNHLGNQCQRTALPSVKFSDRFTRQTAASAAFTLKPCKVFRQVSRQTAVLGGFTPKRCKVFRHPIPPRSYFGSAPSSKASGRSLVQPCASCPTEDEIQKRGLKRR